MTTATNQEDYLGFLDALRAVFILFVVFIHAFGYTETTNDAVSRTLWYVVSAIAVQGFYLCDGFLAARRLDGGGGRGWRLRWVGRSARRLLIPWAIFGIGYVALRLLSERAGLVSPGLSLSADPWSLAKAFWLSTEAPQLYFLPSLFLIRVAAIGLAPLLRSTVGLALFAVSFLILTRVYIEPAYRAYIDPAGYDPVLHALVGMGFFLAGWLLRRLAAHRLQHPAVPAAIFALAFGLAEAAGPEWSGMIQQTAYLFGMFFLFMHGLFQPGWLILIGQRTMGIYLLHLPVIMKAVQMIGAHFFGQDGIGAVFGIAAGSFLIAFGLSLVVERLGWAGILLGSEPSRHKSQA